MQSSKRLRDTAGRRPAGGIRTAAVFFSLFPQIWFIYWFFLLFPSSLLWIRSFCTTYKQNKSKCIALTNASTIVCIYISVKVPENIWDSECSGVSLVCLLLDWVYFIMCECGECMSQSVSLYSTPDYLYVSSVFVPLLPSLLRTSNTRTQSFCQCVTKKHCFNGRCFWCSLAWPPTTITEAADYSIKSLESWPKTKSNLSQPRRSHESSS